MAKKQLGSDYILWVNTNTSGTGSATWKAIMCQRDLTINTPFDTIDASTKCGNETLVQEGQETVEGTAALLQKDTADTNHMTTFEFRQIARDGISRQYKAAPKTATAADDGKIVYTFNGKITNVSDTFPNKELATVSFALSVDGQIEETEYEYEP